MMKFTYDKEADAAYIYLEIIPDNTIKRTVELKENVFLDYDAHNKIVGIEILEASKSMSKKTLLAAQGTK